MDEETQKYYEALFEMYASDGWKYLMEDLQKNADTYRSIVSVTDEKSLYFQKGRLEATEFILKHEDIMKQAYEEINANL